MKTIEGEQKRLGFFATRIVEAEHSTDSRKNALKIVEAELKDKLLNHTDDPPEFVISEVAELESSPEDTEVTKGFTWYLETEH